MPGAETETSLHLLGALVAARQTEQTDTYHCGKTGSNVSDTHTTHCISISKGPAQIPNLLGLSTT